MNYNKVFTIGLGGMLIAIILVPISMWAQPENAEQKIKGFCGRLPTISSRIDQRIANREAKLEAKRSKISNKIDTNRSNRDAKLAERRAKWDVNRAEHFAKLEERAETDEQKEAVTAFVKAVNTAIAVRRAAIDAAIQNFREGIDEAKASRRAAVDRVVNAFRNSVKAAIEKATSDCESNVDPKIVRENLRNELKTARDSFVSGHQEIEKLKTLMKPLIIARRDAIKKAIEDFKAAIEQARIELKAAFPPESPEEVPETP